MNWTKPMNILFVIEIAKNPVKMRSGWTRTEWWVKMRNRPLKSNEIQFITENLINGMRVEFDVNYRTEGEFFVYDVVSHNDMNA